MMKDVIPYISSKLYALAQEHNVRILHAIESGSRAWGFPSKDSDYDVRFIYAHDLNHYLSVDRKRDVIETPITHDAHLGVEFDMNGWDVKKAISLALRGNAVVNEWLTSPIRYIFNDRYHQDLQGFVRDTADLRAYYYFYRNYMREPWNRYLEKQSDCISLKHYCYVLRCTLSLKWLEQKETPPPMDVPSLLQGLEVAAVPRREINRLITAKADSIESDTMPRNSTLRATS